MEKQNEEVMEMIKNGNFEGIKKVISNGYNVNNKVRCSLLNFRF